MTRKIDKDGQNSIKNKTNDLYQLQNIDCAQSHSEFFKFKY